MRFQISTLLDRVVKFHQREYEVLPELWRRLANAYAHVQSFTSVVQQTYDLSKMSPTQLEEFLKVSPFSDSQKEEVRHSVDRNNTYRKIAFLHEYVPVKNTLGRFHRYLKRNGVFIPPN
jgi:hypothetical protein